MGDKNSLTFLLNKQTLFSTFGVQDLENLHLSLMNMAPSMVEYYLSDLNRTGSEEYMNKRNIQQTITLDQFHIHFDYDENIFLEIDQAYEDNSMIASFW